MASKNTKISVNNKNAANNKSTNNKNQNKVYKNPIHTLWGKIILWVLCGLMVAGTLATVIYIIITQFGKV